MKTTSSTRSDSRIVTPAVAAREKLGLSREAAAEKLGIGAERLRQFELHKGAKYQRARQIARLYNTSIYHFLGCSKGSTREA